MDTFSSTKVLSTESILTHHRNSERSRQTISQRTVYSDKLIDSTVTTYRNDDRSHSDETEKFSSLPHTTSIAPAA